MTDTTTAAATAREVPLGPGGSVEILVTAGDLRVRGTDGDRVVVRSRDGEALRDDVVIEREADVVRVRDARWQVRLGPLSLRPNRARDLEVDIPRTASLSLRTLSGDVEATGLAGPSRWASASGQLRITTACGPVQVETMSGDVLVEASGAIDLGARTVSGDLRVRALRLETTDIGTTSGDIRVEAELAAGGRHRVSSVSGDVEIATGTPVRLEAQTITGDIRAQGPHHAEGGRGRRTLVVGSGSVTLSVRTTSGDVFLRAADGTVPPPAARPPIASQPGSAAPAQLRPVAEASAGPVRPRPVSDEDTQAWNAPQPVIDRREALRLDVLRALERGELDIETASHRLQVLDDAGPRNFRGWC